MSFDDYVAFEMHPFFIKNDKRINIQLLDIPELHNYQCNEITRWNYRYSINRDIFAHSMNKSHITMILQFIANAGFDTYEPEIAVFE